MTSIPSRDRVAIAGIGRTEYSKRSGVTTLTLATRAIAAALADAGLSRADVDGVACHRLGDSADPALVAQVLGRRDVRFVSDTFGGGSACIVPLAAAANAIATGTADVVVVWRALNGRSGVRMSGAATNPAVSSDGQHWAAYHHASAPQQFAMFARAFMDASGVDEEHLGHVAVAQRDHAVLNGRAMLRERFTLDDYLESRWICEPLRLLDCCLETDAAVALVLVSAERARDLRRPPVTIAATALGGGCQLTSNHHVDLAESAAALLAPRLYAAAGTGPDDIDVAELYDAFSPLVLLQLEAYGLCGRGESGAVVASGATALGGRLPVNTHGGHLSEGYVHGLNHVVEAVEQLRGDSGDRQVPGAEVALATAQPGVGSGLTGAVVLRAAR